MEISDDMKARLEAITEAFAVLLTTLEKHWLPGRTMALAQTKIEEAHMWLMQMPNDPTIQHLADKQKRDNKIIPVTGVTPELNSRIKEELDKRL